MESFFKGFRKNKQQKACRHEKLSEGWGEIREPVKEGMIFYVKYLGSTLVEEIDDEAQSYGTKISADAVKTIVSMAKASGKKLPKMTISVSLNGIKVLNAETNAVFTDLNIYRICFCTADKSHEKVFAYVARSTENETMECHAFLCPKRKIAQAVTLTVAQAFALAKEEFEHKEKKEQENKQRKAFESLSSDKIEVTPQAIPPPVPARTVAPDMGFEDNFADMDLSSGFPKPSQSNAANNPFSKSTFSTGLSPSDMDAELNNVMKQTLEQRNSDLNRTPSVDDLLLL